jgi:MioC protein
VHITGAATGHKALIIAPIMRPCHFCPAHFLMQLTLLVGSVHGNARQIAQTLAFAAPEHGASAQVLDMQGLTIAVFDTPGLLVLCCSTTGSGDVPDNARGLYQSLDADARFLGHVRFGLVALGDSSYGDTFYGGAKAFQSRLQDLGAQLVGEACVLDALDAAEPDAVALAWFATWIAQARRLGLSLPSPV